MEKSKILIYYEPQQREAQNNMEMLDKIYQIIQNEFKDSTIIVVAHRLSTIMNQNRVMML